MYLIFSCWYTAAAPIQTRKRRSKLSYRHLPSVWFSTDVCSASPILLLVETKEVDKSTRKSMIYIATLIWIVKAVNQSSPSAFHALSRSYRWTCWHFELSTYLPLLYTVNVLLQTYLPELSMLRWFFPNSNLSKPRGRNLVPDVELLKQRLECQWWPFPESARGYHSALRMSVQPRGWLHAVQYHIHR